MSHGLLTLIDNSLAPRLAIVLGRILSARQAVQFADWLADRILRQTESTVFHAVRLNQAVVRGWPPDSPRLDGVVRDVFHQAARGYAHWFRAIRIKPADFPSVCAIDELWIREIRDALSSRRGLILAGAHLSSFNIFLLALAKSGFPIQILTHPDTRGRYRIEHAIWRRWGLFATPVSSHTLRLAVRHLRRGGIVIVAVDWPVGSGEELEFFGRPTRLSAAHAWLAIRSGARILVGTVQSSGAGHYHAIVDSIIKPQPSGQLREDVRALAQQVLCLLESYIRARPDEWMMFLPLWPNP